MLPPGLTRSLEEHCAAPIARVRALGGGCINDAAAFEAGGVPFFVKWNTHAPAGMFVAEADGLARLAAPGVLAVPRPIAWSEAAGERPAYLLMTHFGEGRPGPDFGRRLGAGLARLHRHTAERHGLERDNFIGSLPQRNTRETSWVRFFGEHRLRAQAEIGERSGALPASTIRAVEALCAKLPERIPDDAPASLLHGDLWSGNYGTGADGGPVIFDPAVYYGHREVEIAFTEMFGGFPPAFYDAYRAQWPLEPGYAERRGLYNLYPTLVHANLFGGHYVAAAEGCALRYA